MATRPAEDVLARLFITGGIIALIAGRIFRPEQESAVFILGITWLIMGRAIMPKWPKVYLDLEAPRDAD